MAEMKDIASRIKELEPQAADLEEQTRQLLLNVPNIPHESVPVGKTDEDNELIRTWGELRQFDFEPQSHADLGEQAGLIDFKRAAKVSGARFAVLWGKAARLERALIDFMIELHTSEHGYTEVLPPFMVNAESMTATGQLPKFEEDLFKTTDGYYLVPTAEVPVTNLHRDERLDPDKLPLKYCAFTPCFRAEAGSYGQDTRGLIRQHQFDKVELVWFTHPENSWEAHEQLLYHAEEVLKRLNLPYRVVSLCSGDLGFSAAKCYDLEVWIPSQGRYREISSCSNFVDFQARRGNIRMDARQKGKRAAFVHTLNGSGLAIGRTMVALIENYQQADGTIDIPEVLRDRMGCDNM